MAVFYTPTEREADRVNKKTRPSYMSCIRILALKIHPYIKSEQMEKDIA